MSPVRVRFAPSPTGALHIGGVRTALYNFLLARQTGGTMILRIEDTDQSRYVPGAEEYILESLAWAGIHIDEGVGVGGPHAPYRQSERKQLYRQFAEKLVAEGHAYYAFDTEAELETMRKSLLAAGGSTLPYGSQTRAQMANSLTLPSAETSLRLQRGDEYVIRLKVPADETIHLHDLIRGDVYVHSSQIDDKVLMKSDGMPTYHLANVVDDHLMQISHVIRGEEWLPSAPLHVLLYRSLGWADTMPQFAHLPLLLKPDGHGKLSKRDADQMGFPIFPLNWTDPKTNELVKGFRESGYLPEALLNFLAFLGWNPGTEQELFTLPELINAFQLERIGKAGARFDIQKAKWFNQQYLKQKSVADLAPFLTAELTARDRSVSETTVALAITILKERITFPHELWSEGEFLFVAPTTFDESVAAKKWNAEAVAVIRAYKDALIATEPFTAPAVKDVLEKTTQALHIGTGKILQALRLALTGRGTGPDLMIAMEIIGREGVVARLEHALKTLTVKS
ncbi:MAG: glutamate--tRNA ligase [Cyclobacteriaceae bacterium]|jgi:glutamyl-tRNA synthetase|nr:glutamate--tRNA ligase [Cyclobacteriaceae bacterium]